MGELMYSSIILGLGTRWSPGRFNPGERDRGTHWIRGWVGPRAGLDAVDKIRISTCLESNPGRPTHSPSLYKLSYSNGKNMDHFTLGSKGERRSLCYKVKSFLILLNVI
jgi:hypothetical protein